MGTAEASLSRSPGYPPVFRIEDEGGVKTLPCRIAFLILAALWVRLSLLAIAGEQNPSDQPPTPLREFRGAWVATVSNIDWPSKPGLPTAQQRAELLAIMDKATQLKLNALILHVRPACDALYASGYEPWSEYLTGKMGQAPAPLYDPLAFAVEQAHQRGLELHAWFNPFRAKHSSGKPAAATNHVSRSKPSLVRAYGNQLWLDPGEPAVREYSTTVIMDVVRRYDIDGVHLDDYFYPYKQKDAQGKLLDFPDEPSWTPYKARGGKLSRGDWRRKNVDDFVEVLYRTVKREKPWVKVGLSPFGIWRPGHPSGISGLDAYEELSADARKWLANGWCDYLSPQLYWAIKPAAQSYPALLHWWAGQNQKRRHLWPGSNSSKVGNAWAKEEVLNQIALARKEPGVTGHVHWNISALMTNRGGLANALAKQTYSQPALVPASPWLDGKPPGPPKALATRSRGSDELRVAWSAAGTESVWLWVVQSRLNGNWTTEILPAKTSERIWRPNSAKRLPDRVSVSAVDRCGNAGPAALVDLAPEPKPTPKK